MKPLLFFLFLFSNSLYPVLSQSNLLETVKKNPNEARNLCNKFREFNSKGISASSDRAIAIFRNEIGISPPQAYLLLHCGISSIKSLSLSTPYELEHKIGRLERILRVKNETNTTFSLLKEWIKKASQIEKSI